MSLTASEMTPADIAAVTNNGNGNGGMGGWGNDWWILLLFLFGWGRNGNWGGGGGGSCGSNSTCATPADVTQAVDRQTFISKLDQQTYGLADATFALNNAITTGFAGAELSRCNQQAAFMQQLFQLQSLISGCCCETQRAIEGNKFQSILNTNSIQKQISDCCCDLEKAFLQNRFDAQVYNGNTLQAIDKLGDRIIGYMSNKEMQDMRDQLFLAKIRGELQPAPVPAYPVQNPYCCNDPCGWRNCA